MSGISTHVLDLAAGRPAAGIPVALEYLDQGTWQRHGGGMTDADGRVGELVGTTLQEGAYRLTFEVSEQAPEGFYPEVVIVFRVSDPEQHYHVPLLLSPFGYVTYRGS